MRLSWLVSYEVAKSVAKSAGIHSRISYLSS